jgi:Bacterial SH3 domain
MRILLTTAALASALVVAVAGTASALTPAECQVYAQQQAELAYPAGKGLVTGGVLGLGLGAAVGAATGGNVGKAAGTGAAIGAGVGVASYQTQKENYRLSVLQNCLASSGPPPPPPQPVNYPPGAFSATVYINLNVRQGGGTGFPVLFSLLPGEHFTAQCSNSPYPGWCYITRSNGQTGYASQKYIYPG